MTDTVWRKSNALDTLFARMETARGSAGIALLTDAQFRDLETLCSEVNQLCARGLVEDAAAVVRLAISLVGGGPPAKE